MKRIFPVLMLSLALTGCGQSPERETVAQIDKLLQMNRPYSALQVADDFLESHPHSTLVQGRRVFALVKAGYFDQAYEVVRELPRGGAVLEMAWDDSNPVLRENTAQFIGIYGVEGVSRRVLRRGLNDAEPTVRAYCARALGRLYAAESVRDLYECLQDEHWWVRAEAVTALSRVGGHRVTGWVIGLVSDGDAYVRWRAMAVLREQPRAETVAVLTKMLTEGRAPRRLQVAVALASLGETNTVPVLATALQTERTSRWLIEVVRDFPTPIATNLLHELISSPNRLVRQQASNAWERVLSARPDMPVMDATFVVEPGLSPSW